MKSSGSKLMGVLRHLRWLVRTAIPLVALESEEPMKPHALFALVLAGPAASPQVPPTAVPGEGRAARSRRGSSFPWKLLTFLVLAAATGFLALSSCGGGGGGGGSSTLIWGSGKWGTGKWG